MEQAWTFLSSRSRFFSKLAVSFLRPPIPRSRIEFIFLVLVKVPFGHLTLCRTLIPTKSIQTFNQVFRRNYHLECKKKKKKTATKEIFYMFWNMLLWLSIRLLFHLHHSKWQFRRKIPSSGLYSRLHVKFYTSITTKCSFFFSKMQVIIGWTPFFRPLIEMYIMPVSWGSFSMVGCIGIKLQHLKRLVMLVWEPKAYVLT